MVSPFKDIMNCPTNPLSRIAGATIYFVVSSLSYVFIFDKTAFKHPKFLKNQVKMEIRQAVDAMPFIALFTTPFFFAEIRGYSKLYDTISDEPYPYYNWLQFPLFLMFTDPLIYLIHRGLHHPLVYKHMHKAHHKWIMPTPYASVAFHPVDGFLQSLPYHVFPFIFPLQKFAYLGLFFFVQLWTVFIHDGEYVANGTFLNGAACHTMHHLYFNYNYGQYTTMWDRLLGSYRKPNEELFRREEKMGPKEWERQVAEMEKVVKEVEGEDDRTYGPDETKKVSLSVSFNLLRLEFLKNLVQTFLRH
jgi:lathosterol oxidase